MDFFGSFMFILQTILLWAGVLDTKGDALLATSILLIMLRAIGDMRCFEKTRYLVKLIIEVFKDMESFFYILVHSLVSFAVAYYCLSSDRSSRNFFEEIGGMYRLTYGDFAYVDDYGVFEWTFFVVSTLIVPLVFSLRSSQIPSSVSIATSSAMTSRSNAVLSWKLKISFSGGGTDQPTSTSISLKRGTLLSSRRTNGRAAFKPPSVLSKTRLPPIWRRFAQKTRRCTQGY